MALTKEQSELAVSTLQQMVDLLGLPAKAEDISGGEEAVITLRTEEAGRLIGRKGQCLESMELLLNRLIHKAPNDFAYVVLDVDGYRHSGPRPGDGHRGSPGERRGEASPELERQAVDLAKEVRRWGEPKTLGPLTAGQRRGVHMILRNVPGVETESGPDEGNGMKKLTIRPAPGKAGSDTDAAAEE